jgi:hypothetical protein
MGTGHCKRVSNSIFVFEGKWPLASRDFPRPPISTLPFHHALGSHINYSVNIGGWLVTEPFIVPALYQKYSNLTYGNGSFEITDEWKLVTQMKADGSIGDLENHYDTFIVSSFTKFAFSFSSSHHSDGGRLRPNCRGRLELGSPPSPFLGHRDGRGGALSGERPMEMFVRSLYFTCLT